MPITPAPPTLTPNRRAAILRLLGDDDEDTAGLVQRKLAEIESPDGLRELRALAMGRAANRLDRLIAEVAGREADAAFLAHCAAFGEFGDIEEASWLLASAFLPDEQFIVQRRMLDDWGARVASRLSGALDRSARVRVIAEFLGREMRLRGNEGEYYSLENSLLPRVIDTRLGIPITLSLVYILVGKRAGLAIDGVGLPGHFLVRHEDVFFDPFHGGHRVGVEECAALMEQQNLVLTPRHLLPTTPRQMLLRTLTNINFVAEQTDPPLAARTGLWLEALRQDSDERE